MVLSSRGLGHRPFTAGTGVRIPLGLPYISQLSLTRKVEWGVEVERTCRTAHTHIHRDTSWLLYGINFIHMTICCQQENVTLLLDSSKVFVV